jgi:chromosome segregation protein
MYLKKIEIQGFKSFAKKTVLEFSPGIISVVGPNGSGKSNFADSIRWVLGEQSMKAVRSKKSEDVIFAGSDKKSRAGFAEVSIVFDNADRKLPLDFAEVAISRRLFRDGESEYLINGRPVRLMDIVEILSKTGYGNTSYQIISQGTIDQMVLAGPAAIKSLIEEACGVKPYYLKRERSERKLERSEQNLLRVADLIAEIEPRLKSLRRQAKRMQARDEIAAELKSLQEQFFTASYQRVTRDLADYESKIKYYDKEISDLTQALKLLGERIQNLEKTTVGKSSDYTRLQQDIRKLEKEKHAVTEELAAIRGQQKAGVAFGGDARALELAKQELEAQCKILEEKIAHAREQVVLGEKNASQHRKISESLNAELDKLKKQFNQAKSSFDFERVREEMERIFARYQSLLYQIKNFHTEEELEHLKEDAENLEIAMVKLKDRVAQISSLQFNQYEGLSLSSGLAKIFEQKEKIQAEIAKIESSVAIARSQESLYSDNLAQLRKELVKVSNELKRAGSKNTDEHWEKLAREEAKLSALAEQFASKLAQMEHDLKRFLEEESAQKQELLRLERDYRTKQDYLSKIKDQKGLVLIEKARIDANLESLFFEVRKSLGQDGVLKIKNAAPLASVDPGLEQKIMRLRAQLESIGGVDELTLQEYKETEERYNYLTTQSADLKKAVEDLRKVIAELDAIIKTQFTTGFESINNQFSEYFRILFSGGRARMSLVRERKPIIVDENGNGSTVADEVKQEPEMTAVGEPAMGKEEVTGIEIRATPPGKKLALLSALSGGERTMTAIALLMAILSAFPSPFVVLDEVDAALDEANSIRFGKILSRLSHQTQFITITHNRETMRQASALYGVTMGDDGISKVLSIKLDRAVEIAA